MTVCCKNELIAGIDKEKQRIGTAISLLRKSKHKKKRNERRRGAEVSSIYIGFELIHLEMSLCELEGAAA